MKIRLAWGAAALVQFAAMVVIALFVTQPFVRGHLGDVIVVTFIHCAVRAIFPNKPKLLALYVFLFACFVEFTQYIHLLDMLGLAHITWLRVVVGVTFDWGDILCYAIGCAIMGAGEFLYAKRDSIKRQCTSKDGSAAA